MKIEKKKGAINNKSTQIQNAATKGSQNCFNNRLDNIFSDVMFSTFHHAFIHFLLYFFFKPYSTALKSRIQCLRIVLSRNHSFQLVLLEMLTETLTSILHYHTKQTSQLLHMVSAAISFFMLYITHTCIVEHEIRIRTTVNKPTLMFQWNIIMTIQSKSRRRT